MPVYYIAWTSLENVRHFIMENIRKHEYWPVLRVLYIVMCTHLYIRACNILIRSLHLGLRHANMSDLCFNGSNINAETGCNIYQGTCWYNEVGNLSTEINDLFFLPVMPFK